MDDKGSVTVEVFDDGFEGTILISDFQGFCLLFVCFDVVLLF